MAGRAVERQAGGVLDLQQPVAPAPEVRHVDAAVADAAVAVGVLAEEVAGGHGGREQDPLVAVGGAVVDVEQHPQHGVAALDPVDVHHGGEGVDARAGAAGHGHGVGVEQVDDLAVEQARIDGEQVADQAR